MALRALNAAALIHHLFSIYWLLKPKDFTGVTDPTTLNLQRYPARFLTGWNMVVQAVFLCACVLEDAHGRWRDRSGAGKLVRRHVAMFADFVFGSLVFPMTILVAAVFWSLFAVDRELVYPVAIDAVLPWWLNHAIHTDILVVLAMGLCRPRRPPPRVFALSTIVAVTLCYDCVLLHAYIDGEVWIYPVFEKLGSWPKQLMLIALTNLITFLLYFLGEGVNKKIWGTTIQKTKEKNEYNKNS